MAWGGARRDSIGRNRIARSWQDPMGRVAADGEAGADDASHTEGGGRGYELVTVSPEAWAIIWMKSVDEIIEEVVGCVGDSTWFVGKGVEFVGKGSEA